MVFGCMRLGSDRHKPFDPCGAMSKEGSMASRSKIQADAGIGIFWFIGWLFTMAFAKLIWWQAVLGLLVWPYFLGVAVR